VLIIFFFLICILKLVSVDSIWSLQTCGVVYGIKKYSITQLVFFRSFFFFREAAIQKLVLIGFWKWHGDFTTCALSLPTRASRLLERREFPEVWPVGSVDFCVDWEVGVSGGEDAVVGVGQDGGQGGQARALWPVEHLGLKLGELVLEVRESLWQSFDNAGVNRVKHPLLWGTEVLGSLQSWDIVAPELRLVGEAGVLCVQVKMHLSQS